MGKFECNFNVVYYRLTEGAFTWVDGMPLSFNGWLSAPTTGGVRDCVQFNTQKGWLDNNCEVTQPFVCKALRPGMTCIGFYFHHILLISVE